jgi:hypothetical protein
MQLTSSRRIFSLLLAGSDVRRAGQEIGLLSDVGVLDDDINNLSIFRMIQG